MRAGLGHLWYSVEVMSGYTTYLRWGLLGGFALIPFIPFIVAAQGAFLNFFIPDLFFPFITGKNFTFRFIVEALLLLYVLLALKEPKYRPRTAPLFWTMCAFVAWMAVATIFSIDPIKSFWSNFERMEGYLTLLHYLVLFVVAGTVLTAERWWERFFQISVGASVVMGCYALLQFFGVLAISSQSGARVDTTFGNATYLAIYMLIHIFITLFLMVRLYGDEQARRRSSGILTLYGVALVLQGFALYFTETRGAILGLLGGLIVAAAYVALRARGAQWKTLRLYSFGTIGLVALLVGGFFAVRNTSIVSYSNTLERLASISLDDPTTQSRFIIWNMAFEGAKERPLTGWGQENFNFVFNANYDPVMYNQEQWFDRAHNQFLDWLIAGGFPAFVLYLLLFGLAVWAIVRSDRLSIPEQAALLGLLAGYAFNNLFVFDNVVSAFYFYLVLAFVWGLSQARVPRLMFFSKPASDKLLAAVAPIVVVLILGGAWMLNMPGLVRAQELIDALQTNDPATGVAKNPSENFDSFKSALDRGNLGYQETVEQFFQFASNTIAPSTTVSPELKQAVFSLGHQEGLRLLAERPTDARLDLFMAIFTSQFGKADESLSYLEKALQESPGKQQILFQLASVYLARGDTDKALETAKNAFDLAPQFDDARVIYASTLYYLGRGAEADVLLEEHFGTVLVDNDRLLQSYSNLGMYNRVIGIWKQKVETNPNSVEMHLGLASAYFASGDNTNAIAELETISTLDASLAPQMQSLITQIKNGTLKP